MPDAQHITVKPLSGISSDEARKARARAWSFIFQCWQKKQGGSPLTAPATRRRSSMFAPHRSIQDHPDVLGLVRELYSRRPETRNLEPWELQHILWSLRYSDELLDESEISAALEALRVDGEVLA